MMRKLITGALAASALASGIALAAPANAQADGGWDRDHAWLKIPASDLQRMNVDQWCNTAVRIPANTPGSGACNHLVVSIVGYKLTHKNVGGYWAEWYPSTGQNRVGAW